MRKSILLAALWAFALSTAGAHLPELVEPMSTHHEHSGPAQDHHHGDADDRHEGPDSPCEHQAAHCYCAHVTAAEVLDVSAFGDDLRAVRATPPTCRPALDPTDRSVLHVPID